MDKPKMQFRNTVLWLEQRPDTESGLDIVFRNGKRFCIGHKSGDQKYTYETYEGQLLNALYHLCIEAMYG